MADRPVGGRRLSPNLIAGAVLAIIATTFLVWQRPWQSAPAVQPRSIASDASDVFAAQFRALQTARTQAQFSAAAGDSTAAQAWAAKTYASLQALGGTDVRLRFISGGLAGVRTDRATEATVEVSWKPGAASGMTPVQSRAANVTFVLDPVSRGRFAIRSAVRNDGAMPLWLLGAVSVAKDKGTTIISIDGGAGDQIAAEAEHARAAVRDVVKGATGRLVVISPHSEEQSAALLDQPTASIKQIAAVTTTIDGNSRTKTMPVIVINPAVYTPMDARAAQIVMSHEATHAMTKAAGSAIETWVAEGFADYVALHADTAPLAVSAGQVLRAVKTDGAPRQLPTAADFGSQQHGLGATYESAWLIFRMLGADYGDAKVLTFYDTVLGGQSVEKAANVAFGLNTSQLTRKWRAYLAVKSASITS